jgi:hypothetical protein
MTAPNCSATRTGTYIRPLTSSGLAWSTHFTRFVLASGEPIVNLTSAPGLASWTPLEVRSNEIDAPNICASCRAETNATPPRTVEVSVWRVLAVEPLPNMTELSSRTNTVSYMLGAWLSFVSPAVRAPRAHRLTTDRAKRARAEREKAEGALLQVTFSGCPGLIGWGTKTRRHTSRRKIVRCRAARALDEGSS